MGESNKKKAVIITVIALVTILFLLTAGFFVAKSKADEIKKSDKILKNVSLFDLDLGGKTKEEAVEEISGSDKLSCRKEIKAKYLDKTFSYTPFGAGICYDAKAISEEAFNIGRKGSLFNKLKDILKSKNKINVEPKVNVNEETFKSVIGGIARESGIKFENHSVKLFENYAEIKVYDNVKSIDYKKMIEKTKEIVLNNKWDKEIEIPVSEAEKITAKEIYDNIYKEPKDAYISKENGSVTVVPEQIGILVNIEDIEKELKENKKDFKIKITKKYPKVKVFDVSQNLFKDVLGTFKTWYNPNLKGRSQNVTLAAQKINGTILNSGEVFSYNKTVGPRTYQKGFSDGIIYTKDGLEPGLGGGICQVSSTLYNAVLYADLKVVERRNHLYAVGYVRNGLDATVSYGAIDFKFKNNKKYPIKLVAYARGGNLVTTIMGTKENNNKVELYTKTYETYPFTVKKVENSNLVSGQEKVKQNGVNGYKISATKVVKDGNGKTLRTESLGVSKYQPLPKIIEVGTKAGDTKTSGNIVKPSENIKPDRLPPDKKDEDKKEENGKEDPKENSKPVPEENNKPQTDPETPPETEIPENNGGEILENLPPIEIE